MMANNQYVNKVVYGDQTVLDLSDDTFDDAKQLVEGVSAHKKDGQLVYGTRPKFYKYNCNNAYTLDLPIYVPEEGLDRQFCALNNPRVRGSYSFLVFLRQSGTSVQLFSYKDDEVTESAVTITTISNADLRATFRIEKVYFLDSMHMIIQYRWQAAASGYLSPVYIRCIIMKADGSLIAGAQATLSGSPSATLNSDGWLAQGMYEQFLWVWVNTTISTGAKTLTARRMYLNHISGAFTQDTSATVLNISSDVDTYLNDFSVVPLSKAGFFYTNALDVDCVCWFGSYNSANYRTWTLDNAGADVAEIGSKNHWILGMDSFGHTVTIKTKVEDGVAIESFMYLWFVDPTSTTNAWKLVTTFRFPLIIYPNESIILCFENNIITTQSNRYQIERYTNKISGNIAFRLTEIESINLSYDYRVVPSWNAGPESSLFNGVLIV